MVNYPDLSSLNDNAGIGGLMSLPNNSYPFFWLWIFAGIWLIITLSLYFKEQEKRTIGFMLSSMSVACFSILILAVIGTIIGFVSLEIMVYILVFSLMIIGVWFFSD